MRARTYTHVGWSGAERNDGRLLDAPNDARGKLMCRSARLRLEARVCENICMRCRRRRRVCGAVELNADSKYCSGLCTCTVCECILCSVYTRSSYLLLYVCVRNKHKRLR